MQNYKKILLVLAYLSLQFQVQNGAPNQQGWNYLIDQPENSYNVNNLLKVLEDAIKLNEVNPSEGNCIS